AEEVLARCDRVLRHAGLPPDPLRDRRVPRAHVGQPAPARRRSPAAPPPVRRAPPITRLVLAVAALTALIVLGRRAGGWVLGFAAWVEALGAWGAVVFIAGYVLSTSPFVAGLFLL